MMGVKSTDLDLSDLENVRGSKFEIPVQDNYLSFLVDPILFGQFTERTYGVGISFTVSMSTLLAADFGSVLGGDFSIQDFRMHSFYTA